MPFLSSKKRRTALVSEGKIQETEQSKGTMISRPDLIVYTIENRYSIAHPLGQHINQT